MVYLKVIPVKSRVRSAKVLSSRTKAGLSCFSGTMSKHKKSVNWTAIFVGFAVLMTSIAVFENLGKPQYIHPVGILSGVIASVLLVQAKRYGKRPWFWLSIALFTTLHVPLII